MIKTENRILKKFEATDVTIEIVDGVPMFELYSTGMALGYVKTAKGKQYPRTERIDKTVKNADISTVVHDGQLFMNENQLYDFMFEAHTEKCKPFRKWVVEEVLPIINKTGGYVETDMEEEFVNNYLPEHNAIIEVMGIQHYKDGCFGDGCRTLKEEQANDILKEKLALDNGIKDYFRLDCRKSDIKYMKESFVHSNLPDFLQIDGNIDYKECFKNSLKSKIIQAIELWNKGYKTPEIALKIKVS